MKGQIADANVRAMEFLQYGREEFRGLTVFDVISGSSSDLLETLLQNLGYDNEHYIAPSFFSLTVWDQIVKLYRDRL